MILETTTTTIIIIEIKTGNLINLVVSKHQANEQKLKSGKRKRTKMQRKL